MRTRIRHGAAEQGRRAVQQRQAGSRVLAGGCRHAAPHVQQHQQVKQLVLDLQRSR